MKKWIVGMVTLTLLALVLPGAALAQGPEGCETYVVQPGDTLAQIAAEYLDDPWAYPALVFATNRAAADGEDVQTITDPNLIGVYFDGRITLQGLPTIIGWPRKSFFIVEFITHQVMFGVWVPSKANVHAIRSR